MTPRFRLYVAGESQRTRRALLSLHAVCSAALGVDPDVEIVDVRERPDLADADRILATPTVVRLHPLPELRVIGDLSDLTRLAEALDLNITSASNGDPQ